MSKILDFIKSAGASLLGGVKDIIDEVVTSKEELGEIEVKKKELELKLTELVNSHVERLINQSTEQLKILEEARVKDLESARNAAVKIQQSENASFLAKNTAYWLDLFIGLVWGVTTFFIFAKLFNLEIATSESVDMVNVLAIYTTVSNIFMIIVGFHRGSSVGQQKSMDTINKQQNK